MKQKLLLSLLFVAVVAVADSSNLTVRDLTNGCAIFKDNKDFYKKQVLLGFDEDGKDTEISANEIRDILELNVVSYFNIKGYDTDLKKELYKETDEYQRYETELKQIRDEIKESSYIYIHKLRNVYDLEKGGFRYDIILGESDYVNFPGYINHRTLCIEYATKRFSKNSIDVNKWWGGSFYNYTQRVYFPVPDKRVALRIEEAGDNKVGVLFVFKIDSTKVDRPGIWPQTFILTKTEGIYIVNTETGEVYCKVL